MRSVTCKLLLFLPLAIFVAVINWHVDPARIFNHSGKGVETEIASIMLSQRNMKITNLHFNDRLLQRIYADRLSDSPDTLVFGSSQSRIINNACFPDGSLYNAWVNLATLEDYLGIYQVYYERGLKPRRVVLEISPWLLRKKEGYVRFQALYDDYQRCLQRLNLKDSYELPLLDRINSRRYLELLSPSYFQISFNLFGKFDTRAFDITPTMETMAERTIRFPDGSLQYGEDELNRTPEVVRRFAVDYFAESFKVRYFDKETLGLDPDYIIMFTALVDELQSEGIEVVFLLPPIHPSAYELLLAKASYYILTGTEKRIREIADEKGIEVIGSSDASYCGLDESDFVDGNHITRSAMIELCTPATVETGLHN